MILVTVAVAHTCVLCVGPRLTRMVFVYARRSHATRDSVRVVVVVGLRLVAQFVHVCQLVCVHQVVDGPWWPAVIARGVPATTHLFRRSLQGHADASRGVVHESYARMPMHTRKSAGGVAGAARRGACHSQCHGGVAVRKVWHFQRLGDIV